MSTKFFAVGPLNNLIGSFDSRDAAAGACQDAAREDGSDGEGYTVCEEGSVDIVEVSPNLGDCRDEEYDAELERLESCYTEAEKGTRYSVTVRRARRGEADGTYMELRNGDMQILGGSVETPEDLRELQEAAWQKFCA